jgi:hypothetical protein
MRATIKALVLFCAAGCGDSANKVTDGGGADAARGSDASAVDAPVDASLPGPPDAQMFVRVQGHVELNGSADPSAVATLLAPVTGIPTALTNADGDFYFDVPKEARVVIKVEHSGIRPLIRSYVAREPSRIRQYYLLSREEEGAVTGLGHTIDEGKALLEIDFRNAALGGYGVTMTDPGAAVVTAGFGIALEDDGDPVTSQLTVAGGGGSTLMLGNIPPGDVSFTPIVPSGASLPCQPCDAQPIPLQAGAVTWYDFECGSATDCL